jgi:hypothetical protein
MISADEISFVVCEQESHWESMGFYGILWENKNRRCPVLARKLLKINGILWDSVGFYGSLWESIGLGYSGS